MNAPVGSRHELVANLVHIADATRQWSRDGVGGEYLALAVSVDTFSPFALVLG